MASSQTSPRQAVKKREDSSWIRAPLASTSVARPVQRDAGPSAPPERRLSAPVSPTKAQSRHETPGQYTGGFGRRRSSLADHSATPTARLRALSQSAARPASVLGRTPREHQSSPPHYDTRRDSIAVGIVTSLSMEELATPAALPDEPESPLDTLLEYRRSFPPKPTSPLPPLPPEAEDALPTPTRPRRASSPPLPSPPSDEPTALPPLPATAPRPVEARRLSATVIAALADTPPRARPPLPPKSAARNSRGSVDMQRSRSASSASVASGKRRSILLSTAPDLLSTTPVLGLSHPRPRNPPTRTPSLSNTTSASSRASSSVFTPGSSAIRGSAYSNGDVTDWTTSDEREKEELDVEELGLQDGPERLRVRPPAGLRVEPGTPQSFGLGIEGWGGSSDGSPLMGMGEGEDFQGGVDDYIRFARSLPSPVPPLSARSQLGTGAWSSLPSELRGITAPAPPTLSPQPQHSPSFRRQRQASDDSDRKLPSSSSRPPLDHHASSFPPQQFFDARLHPSASSRSPLVDESDAYLSVDESGMDFMSDDDEGGESYSQHYLPFASGLGITSSPDLQQESFFYPQLGERREWDEEEILDATGGVIKQGLVDWTEKGIDRMAIPSDTTHLILTRSTTPRQVPLLLRKIVPTLSIGLIVLDISNCALLEVPLAVASCSQLQELDIKGNPLATRTLPPFLATLSGLRVLIADGCGITHLPSSLSQLTRLHTLSVRFNALRTLPAWLSRLEQLETLLVDGNPFHFQWSQVVAPILAQPLESMKQPPPAADELTPSARSSLVSSVANTSVELPIPPSPPQPQTQSLRSKVSKSSLRHAASKVSLRSASSTYPSASAAPAPALPFCAASLPASPTPGQHAFSTPPPASPAYGDAQARVRHQSEAGAIPSLPSTPVSATDSTSSAKKWSTKIFKKAGARLRSGSTSGRPGGLEARGYSEPVTRTEESLLESKPTGIRARVLSRPQKLPPGLALRAEARDMGKRHSFLQLDASPVAGESITSSSALAPASSMDHSAGLKGVMAYLKDLDDLSVNLTLPASPVDAPAASPILRHSPSLGSISPSPSPSTHSIRRAQSSRRIPSRLERSRSGRFSQVMDEEGTIASGRTTPSASDPPSAVVDSPAIKLKDDPVKRAKVITEIVETEKSYLKGLQELCDIYIVNGSQPVNSSSGRKDTVLPAAERRAVFGNVEAIRDFHEKIFLPDLLEAAQTSPSKLPSVDACAIACDVADVFVRHAAFLKIYASFVINFDAALARIQSWSLDSSRPTTASSATSPQLGSSGGNPLAFDPSAAIVTTLSTNKRKRIKAYLKRCKAHPFHSQISLESYLLLPVQRVPRYRMLLESLVACTPLAPSSTSLLSPSLAAAPALEPDPVIQNALEMISDVATAMNERKRETEGRAQLLYWQQRIGNRFRSPLVQPHRTLLRSGTWTLVRTVKRSSTYLDSTSSAPSPSASSSSLAPEAIHTLHTEPSSQTLIALLCSDLLVLAKEPASPLGGGTADPNAPVDLYTVLRLNSAGVQRPPPVSLFGGDGSMLRITCDSRAILYIQCARKSEAVSWRDAINMQQAINT